MKPKSQQIMIKLSLFFVQLLALIPSYLTSEIFQDDSLKLALEKEIIEEDEEQV